MFDPIVSDHNDFIERTRRQREERRINLLREESTVVIQKNWRGFKARKLIIARFRGVFDAAIASTCPASELLQAVKYLSYKFKLKDDRDRFESLIRFIMHSNTADPNASFLSLAVHLSSIREWISVTKWIITNVLNFFTELEPYTANGAKFLNLLLSFTLVVTNFTQWPFYQDRMEASLSQLRNVLLETMIKNGLYESLHKLLSKGLARHSPAFTGTSLTGILTLALRPLLCSDFRKDRLLLFIPNILSVPTLVFHIQSMMNETYDAMVKHRVCSRTILVYHENPTELDALMTTLDGSYVLCFIANLIQLSLLEEEVLAVHCSEFCVVLSKLMRHLGSYVGTRKSNSSTWHPILGWFAQSFDSSFQGAMPTVTKQLRLVWNKRMVHLLFGDLYAQNELDRAVESTSTEASIPINQYVPSRHSQTSSRIPGKPFSRVKHGLSNFLNRFPIKQHLKANRLKPSNLSPTKTASSTTSGPDDLPLSLKSVCMLYCFTVGSLREIRNDILAGLTLGDLLPRMWRLIACCGSVSDWSKVILSSRPSWHIGPHASHLLHLFAAASCNLLSILDDIELFDLSKSFTVDELCSLGYFVNNLIYETAMNVTDPFTMIESSDRQTSTKDSSSAENFLPNLFTTCWRLLTIIHQRDTRHPFVDPCCWFIPNLKISSLLSDLRKSKKHASFLLKHMPYIIPHKERVLLFRDRVRADKDSLGVQTRMNWLSDEGPVGAVISIHRNRLVEDGYQQLANLSSAQLRMKIRVQFINEMGLDEVGIDLDGVFKEFLEETLHRVFDPTLNLFRVTSDQRLYPSPSSHIQDNHLLLFEFLGKMLAKAIYEGIVVDVPFANFFLTQLLHRERAGFYSFLDELETLDKELYKSLTYIKHYEDDISDLEFTYSYSEDCLGQVVVHDLCPGGRHITVTNDLKISYVHQVAQFRMYKQIRSQTASFIRGFYSILKPDWLAMFSAPELQKLISGDSVSVNIEDLKQNTHYSGGFHGNHRVIKWLWDVLRHDFNENERSLFLKFVTSCSRPPLLGFANLEPPFCIRCVQYTNEDQDVGDTVGSIIKGFFGVGSRREEISRLPTASTCFNLLKLPNYTSRSTLRDKLRYAIHSNAGFELS